MSTPFESSQLEISTTDAPITSTTIVQESINLPLAIALPICLFFFLVFLVILTVCLVRRKKSSQKPVEPPMSRGSVEGSSDNGDNNNKEGAPDNHQTHEFTTDREILEVGGKPNGHNVSPKLSVAQRNTRNSDEAFCNRKNPEDTESTTESLVDGEENRIPVVIYENETSDCDSIESVAVASLVCQQSEMKDTTTEIPNGEQVNFEIYTAVYSFDAENENQMSLVQNDVVLVAETEEHEGWLCGWKKDSSSRTGWFPKSHVRKVEQHSSGTIGSKISASAESDDDDLDEDARKYEYRALYAFDGAKEGELAFEAGDSLVVLHEVPKTGWLYGQRGDEVGWFPETYVEVIPGSNLLKSVSFDIESDTISTYDQEEILKTVEQNGLAIAPTDSVLDGSHLSPSVNTLSLSIPILKNALETNQEDATPSSVSLKRPSVPSGKPSISDRLGLSKIKNFKRRKSSTDKPVVLKEIVPVHSPASADEHSREETLSATRQKRSQSPGKKGKKDPSRPVISPLLQTPRRHSLLNPLDQKVNMELESFNGDHSSHGQNLMLYNKVLKEMVTKTEEEPESRRQPGVVINSTDDTRRTEDVASDERDSVKELSPKPLQLQDDDTRRQWDIALEHFDRILEGSNDPNEDDVSLRPTNHFGLSRSMEKMPEHTDRSTSGVTQPGAVNVAGASTLQLTPRVNCSKTREEEESVDRSTLMHRDEALKKSEFELLSFAPPGFNDSEEVLSPKFLSYLSQVGSIDKSRLSRAGPPPPLPRQSSLHPPLPPKPSWSPASDEKEVERNKDGDVSKEDRNDGTLTFTVQKGRSNRNSLSTLLLPDVVRGYITADEYEQLQIPPPAGFSSDSEENGEANNHIVSLESLSSRNYFHEIQTPRYFGRTMYGHREHNSMDDSPAFPAARQKVSDRVEAPFEVETDTVVWKPWGHFEPKITRNSYVEEYEARPNSVRSRHDTSSHGIMFKLSDGSVVFSESDVGLESVI